MNIIVYILFLFEICYKDVRVHIRLFLNKCKVRVNKVMFIHMRIHPEVQNWCLSGTLIVLIPRVKVKKTGRRCKQSLTLNLGHKSVRRWSPCLITLLKVLLTKCRELPFLFQQSIGHCLPFSQEWHLVFTIFFSWAKLFLKKS